MNDGVLVRRIARVAPPVNKAELAQNLRYRSNDSRRPDSVSRMT